MTPRRFSRGPGWLILPPMTQLLLILLRLLFPRDLVARMRELTRRFVLDLLDISQDQQKLADLKTFPEARLWLASRIAFTEEAVHTLIHERARQILGLPYIFTPATRNTRRATRGRCRSCCSASNASSRSTPMSSAWPNAALTASSRTWSRTPSVCALRAHPPPPRSARWRQHSCSHSTSRLPPPVLCTGGVNAQR